MTTVSAIAGVISNMSADILVKFFFLNPSLCAWSYLWAHISRKLVDFSPRLTHKLGKLNVLSELCH